MPDINLKFFLSFLFNNILFHRALKRAELDNCMGSWERLTIGEERRGEWNQPISFYSKWNVKRNKLHKGWLTKPALKIVSGLVFSGSQQGHQERTFRFLHYISLSTSPFKVSSAVLLPCTQPPTHTQDRLQTRPTPVHGQFLFYNHTDLLQSLWKNLLILYAAPWPLRTLRSPWMWGNRLPVHCALKSPDPFCKSIRAQSKHLSSKPF